ncbi:MAG TPA: hypothetical protein VFM69_06350 [Pricia sp.]|nr:hypothetical protein [Pricia sp.]
MKKYLIAICIGALTLGSIASCEAENQKEYDNVYQIDKDKVESPGEKGNG